MSGVKRYEHAGDYCGPRCGFEESADGDWVLASDYDAMQAERDGANERAGLLLKAKDKWAERARAAEAERDQLRAAISDPESVFVNMKRGTIAKPGLRSMIDLYGEVPNCDETQLLEITQLRAEVERLQSEMEDLMFALADAEHRAENAGRNASAFEDRMGDLQVENGKLRAEIEALREIREIASQCAANGGYLSSRDLIELRELLKK